MKTAEDVLSVDEWQAKMMADLGLGDGAIMELLAEERDWHEVAALLDAGCPSRLVTKILV